MLDIAINQVPLNLILQARVVDYDMYAFDNPFVNKSFHEGVVPIGKILFRPTAFPADEEVE
jgi:hypothetical protein